MSVMRDFLKMRLCDKYPCPDCCDIVKREVAETLDLNFSRSELIDYRVTRDNRLQVGIQYTLAGIDIGDLRDYLSRLVKRADENKIDLIVSCM